MAEVEVINPLVSMKIDSNRFIYVRYHEKDDQYHNIQQQVPIGMSRREKEIFLMDFRDQVIERIRQERVEEPDAEVTEKTQNI